MLLLSCNNQETYAEQKEKEIKAIRMSLFALFSRVDAIYSYRSLEKSFSAG